MARIIVGGYAEPIDFNLSDGICRAIQNAMLLRLGDGGKGFFFRMGGEAGGKGIQHVVWISTSSAIRWEYDSDVLPELNEEWADGYKRMLESLNGIIVPSKTEYDAMTAAIEAEESAPPAS